MGSEIVIPGTPLDQIPTYDRPVFDASKQNGFLSALNPATPAPGSSVQRFSLVLSNQQTGSVNPSSGLKTGQLVNLAAGATSASFASICGLSSEIRYARALIWNINADSTAGVNLTDRFGSQAKLPASMVLDLGVVDVQNATFVNADSVVRSVNLYLTADPPSRQTLSTQVDLAAVLGLVWLRKTFYG